jgi:mannosyltransferase OCH1-like enzyme
MIEKNIFQSWNTKNLPPSVKEKIDRFIAENPEYAYHLYDDAEMDAFVKEHFTGEIVDCYNRLNIIVAKVDFWRYLVLYRYGGVYVDMDSSIEQPLHTLIRDTDEAIITAERNPYRYVQWGLIFAKGHPILRKTIEKVVENIQQNRYPNDIHQMTGPSVYSRAIAEVHRELFHAPLFHSQIRENTDITFTAPHQTSYRLYGFDYGGVFQFKHSTAYLLYTDKKHWCQESREKPLLR